MLVQFRLKNFLSFKDEAILDMSAVNAYKEHQFNLIKINEKESLLKVASIYGANASGKSNLYIGMKFFKEIIEKSLNNVDDKEKKIIDRLFNPFRFDKDKDNTEFEIIQIINDYEYKYGFEYNDNRIESEWMYRKNINTNRMTTVFERDKDKVQFGASVKKECNLYQEQIPSETLVLSFFNKLKLKTQIFKTVYAGITFNLIANSDVCEREEILYKILPSILDRDIEKKNLLKFLTSIDTGIKDIRYVKDGDNIRFHTIHHGRNKDSYSLNLMDESEGSLKSIIIYIFAKTAIHTNRLMFVDELDIKLHPLLLKFIIDLFYNENSKAQLIYTTHDTTLMDKKFFRRDQIWFVEKDDLGYSKLSSLSDFKVRSDASFEKDYLAGVYGGIPTLKDFNMKEGE